MFEFKRKSLETDSSNNENVLEDNNLSVLAHNEKRIVDKISNKISETNFVVENLISTINTISEYVEVQLVSIDNVVNEINTYSALAEEVSSNIESSKQIYTQTLQIAEDGSEAVNESINAMEDIEGSVNCSKSVVNTLNNKAADINNMLDVIKDIANNTNLLALNASIEAARAGEAGRGFSVVAAEVKKLAARSMESVSFISSTIREINESIRDAMIAMDDTMERVKKGSDIANNTLKVFKNIIDSVNKSNNVAEEIVSAVSMQTKSLENVIYSTDDMNNTSGKLVFAIEVASLNTQYAKTSLFSLSQISEDLKVITNDFLKRLEMKDKEDIVLKTCLKVIPKVYDPALNYDFEVANMISNLHAGLLTIGSSGEISPGIAKNWYVEDDNCTWVFNLRKGAKFHNGKEVTAEDVKYCFERLLSPKLKSPNNWVLEDIEGAVEFKNGRVSTVSGIKIINRYCISIKLSKPYSGFLLNLGQFFCTIMDREELEKGNIVGCGAFTLEKKGEDYCALVAFKDFFNGAPYIDKLEIKFDSQASSQKLIDKEYDFMITDNKEDMNKIKEVQYLASTTAVLMGTYYIGFNLESNSIFAANKELRKALNLAVNRKRIVDELLGGMGQEAKGPVPPGILDNSYLPAATYNPQLAKELLRKNNADGKSVNILYRDGSEALLFNKITAYIIEDLNSVGIDCKLVKVPPSEYLNPESIKKCDLCISRWIADSGDADNFLQPIFNYANVANLARYNNPEVIKRLEEAKKIINPNKKSAMYKEIQEMIIADMPWISLYHPKIAVGFRKDALGLRVNPLGLFGYDNIISEKV